MHRDSSLFKVLAIMLLMVSASVFAATKHCKHPHQHKAAATQTSGVKNKHCHKIIKHANSKKMHNAEHCKKTTLLAKPFKPHPKTNVRVVTTSRPPMKVVHIAMPVYKPHPLHCYKDFKDVAPCFVPKVLRDGFYVGVAGGVDSYRIRQERREVLPLVSATQFNPALSAVGTVGGLYAGYGKYFNRYFYAGAEVFGTTTGASTAFTINTNAFDGELPGVWQTYIHVNSNFGISLLPGLKVNDSSLVYLRFGYSRLSIRTSEVENFSVLAHGSNGKANWTSGMVYGIGMETALYANWSLRGEYTHTEYNSITAPNMIMHVFASPDVPLAGSIYFPSDNQFMLGLSYHIC